MNATNASTRIATLDGLRGIAILSVLIHHGCQFPDRDGFRSWNSLISFGFFGGQLFLVMSGYFMTSKLLKVRQGRQSLGSLYRQRYLRLAPLYYLTLALFLTAIPFATHAFTKVPLETLMPRWESLIYYLFGSANLSIARFGTTGAFEITWTLSVQEQFFLLWIPITVLLARTSLKTLCVVVIAVAMLGRPLAMWLGVSAGTIHVLTPFRMDALAIGSLVAIMQDESPRGNSRWIVPATAVATLTFAVVIFLFPVHYSQWYGRAGYAMMGVVSALWLLTGLCVSPGSAISRVLSNEWLGWYGKRSYAIYLLHVPVHYGLTGLAWLATGRPYERGLMSSSYLTQATGVATIFVCIPVAWLIWRFVESPLEKYRKQRPAEAIPAPDTKKNYPEDRPTGIEFTPVSLPMPAQAGS